MKRRSKLIVITVVIVLIASIVAFVFRSEESGPVYVEAVSDDGVLKLTMMLEKTKFTTNPREPVKIILALKNIGDEEITLTFHYKSKFDFMIFDDLGGEYTYRWSYDHIGGPVDWAADPLACPINITLEQPEICTVVLRPGEGINETLMWDLRRHDTKRFISISPKGKYRVEGFAGLGRWEWPWMPDNPLRFFEYVTPDGTLVGTVLQTPGIDISLV